MRPKSMQAEDLLKLVSTPMPFGKHKGLKMEEVPKDYIKWALREMANLDPNMRHTMEKLMRGESLDEEATVCDPV